MKKSPHLEALVPLLDLLLVVSRVLAEVLYVVVGQPVSLAALGRQAAITFRNQHRFGSINL